MYYNRTKLLEADITESLLSFKTEIEVDPLLLLAMQVTKPLLTYDA